jgi:hypothetical protein
MCTRISELVLGGGAQRENCAAELRSDETSCVASKSPAGVAIRRGGVWMPSNTSNICHTTHRYKVSLLLLDAERVFGWPV